NRGRCGHGGTNEMSTAAATLTAFKISIARRSATLARIKNVGVHAETHRATSLAPFKPCREENTIQSFSFSRLFDSKRTGHNHRPHRFIDVVSTDNPGCGSKIFKPRIRAGANKHTIDRDFLNGREWIQR